ncbi:MAG: type II toxin-antitoxin system VapC family toxin [Spirochaetaceae bacterium]
MLVDTDVLVWNLRGNERARDRLDSMSGFLVSVVTYMELAQGVRNAAELRTLRRALRYWNAEILHLSEDVSARASYFVETCALSHNLQLADALIAASALSTGHTLLTANDRHYGFIDGVDIEVFKP